MVSWTEDQSLPENESGSSPDHMESEFDGEEQQEAEDHEFKRRRLLKQTEALLLVSTEPLTETAFINAVGKRAKGKLGEVIEALNEEYVTHDRAFEILPVAGGFMLFTRPEHGELLRRFLADKARTRLSRAALETLSVIAFRGPVTRVEVDEIRGVDSGGVLRNLLDRRLIRVKGRAEVVGRPLLYEITDEFLKYFGITNVSDLPRHAELTRELGELRDADQTVMQLSHVVEGEDSEDDSDVSTVHTKGNGHQLLSPKNLSEDKLED